MKSILKINNLIYISLILFSVTSCTKLAQVPAPVTSTSSASVFTEDVTATAVLTNLYAQLSSGLLPIARKTGLSSDELTLWNGVSSNADILYYTNALTAQPVFVGSVSITAGSELWAPSYNPIYNCNAAIEGLTASSTLTPSVKQQLLGEAKFMRAFFYFYLVNLYGDVPMQLSTDYKVNSFLPRTTKAQVYQQIITDLKDAKSLLSPVYVTGQLKPYATSSQQRVRPTSWAASALLARVYLYLPSPDYANAETEASNVINNSSLFSLSSLSNSFLASIGSNNNEAIWQLQPVNISGSLFWNTEDARFFVLNAAPAGFSVSSNTHTSYLSPQMLAAFEPGDARKTNWVSSYTDGTGTYYFPNKYKVGVATATVTEYLNVFKLDELFLIRAEARANGAGTGIGGAISDLNVIRARATLGGTSATTQTALMAAILHERQVELFTEWGHRWFDLKRTGTIDAVMNVVTPLKGNSNGWKSYQQLYPILINDITNDPNLVQNTGY